jgi:Spy/CpxP family protein refolding chaperone
MNRRTMLTAAAVTGVALVTGAAVFAHAHGGRGAGMMKRMVSAMIDEALEPAKVTPDQRARIYVVRDRVFAAMETHRQSRGQHMQEALALFEADTVDQGRLAAFAAQREAEHRQLADLITQAITEVHDVLNPVQRRAVADWIRTHRPGPHG